MNLEKPAIKRTGSAAFSKIQIAAPRAIGQYDRMIRHHRGTAFSERLGISKVASELAYSSITTTKMFYDHSKLSDAEYLQSVGSDVTAEAAQSKSRRIVDRA